MSPQLTRTHIFRPSYVPSCSLAFQSSVCWGKAIIAFLNDFMLRHTVTPNHSSLIPRECVLWEEMRQKQYDQFHQTLFPYREVHFFHILASFSLSLPHTHTHTHTGVCLLPSVLFDLQTKMWLSQVSYSEHKSPSFLL